MKGLSTYTSEQLIVATNKVAGLGPNQLLEAFKVVLGLPLQVLPELSEAFVKTLQPHLAALAELEDFCSLLALNSTLAAKIAMALLDDRAKAQHRHLMDPVTLALQCAGPSCPLRGLLRIVSIDSGGTQTLPGMPCKWCSSDSLRVARHWHV